MIGDLFDSQIINSNIIVSKFKDTRIFRNYSTKVWLSLPDLKGLLMRVHYPKLRNIVHTFSL